MKTNLRTMRKTQNKILKGATRKKELKELVNSVPCKVKNLENKIAVLEDSLGEPYYNAIEDENGVKTEIVKRETLIEKYTKELSLLKKG